MVWTPRRLGVLALFGVLLALAAPPTLAAAPADTQGLTPFNSQHYTILTNLEREEAAPFGRHMDAVFQEYSQRFSSFKSRKQEAMPLYLFRTQGQYLDFLDKYGINAANTGGMFFVQRDVQGLATWTQGKPLSQTFAVLQHEGFHQFAFNYIGPDLPIWVNEGIAQYFEDGILVNGKMYLGLAHGRRIASVKSALKEDRTIDFDRLLSMPDKEWHAAITANRAEASLLYDQSWSIVYFLINAENGKYRGPFEQYLRLVSQHRDSARAFEQAFGSRDTSAFRERWEDYAEALEPDSMNTAMERLEFLGQALKFLQERGDRLPASTEGLRAHLQRIGFRATRQEPGRTIQVSAKDESLYEYTLPNGKTQRFQMLDAESRDLLPRLTAPGLDPQPTLVWRRDKTGQLMSEIVFK
jgi:hypothetical protein